MHVYDMFCNTYQDFRVAGIYCIDVNFVEEGRVVRCLPGTCHAKTNAAPLRTVQSFSPGPGPDVFVSISMFMSVSIPIIYR